MYIVNGEISGKLKLLFDIKNSLENIKILNHFFYCHFKQIINLQFNITFVACKFCLVLPYFKLSFMI